MPRLLFLIISAFFCISAASTHAFASPKYRRCARISLPGKDLGTLTNLCNRNLYITWVDDNGNHYSAVGSNSSANIGRIHGPFQIVDATPQSGLDEGDSQGQQNQPAAKSRSPRRSREEIIEAANACWAQDDVCLSACSGRNYCMDQCGIQAVSCVHDANGTKMTAEELHKINQQNHEDNVHDLQVDRDIMNANSGQYTPAPSGGYVAPLRAYRTTTSVRGPAPCHEVLGECR